MSSLPESGALRPLTEQQEHTIHDIIQPWSDDFAIKVAVQDFERAESYRKSNHDWRFSAADELYQAWVGQKYWEGTRIPRASLGIFVAFEQIEALLPATLSAYFSDNPYFQAEPNPGTHPREARAARDLILYQLDHMGDGAEGKIREQLRRTKKDSYIYGTGVCEVGWEQIESERRVPIAELIPIKRKVLDPMTMEEVMAPTGRHKRKVRWRTIPYKVNRPFVRHVSIKDFYIDPNCQAPCVQAARYACFRSLMTVDELDRLRDTPDFKIPDRLALIKMAESKTGAGADWAKASVEQVRGNNWQPQNDTSVDPGSKQIEVVAYHTKERLVWFANRSTLLYNTPHPYGFIPFFATVYVDVPNRFYGLAVTDVVEGEQHLQQGVINGRLDELSLSLHPSTLKKRGVQIPQYQLRKRPGNVVELETPKEDLIREPVDNITQQSYVEVMHSDLRVQKTTGITDIAMMGTPTTGGNSANRTATGINTQTQASGRRVQYLVENDEDAWIEPMLSAVHMLNTHFLDPDQVLDILGPDGEAIQIDPFDVIKASVKITLRASAKMQSRTAMLQSLPLVLQTFMNPALLAQMAKQGMTVDFVELSNMMLDAMNYRSRAALIRQLTPQEQQSLQQPPPEEVLRERMQNARLEAQGEHEETRALSDITKTILEKSLDSELADEDDSKEKSE
jgi:hypothetical protein